MQRFQVKPDEPDKEAPYIGKNIQATRSAYGLDDTDVTTYDAKTSARADAAAAPTPRRCPASGWSTRSWCSSTFEQLQQVRGYYSVPAVLDVDRYKIDGQERDVVVAARELT